MSTVGARTHERLRPALPDAPAEVSQPVLRVVDPSVRRRRQRVRVVVTFFTLVTVVLLLVVVIGHVKLAESQLQIDRMNRETANEQRRYQQLRLQIAELASPNRIVRTAIDQLGMQQPENITYLAVPTQAPDGSSLGGTPAADDTSATLARSWPQVKEDLVVRP